MTWGAPSQNGASAAEAASPKTKDPEVLKLRTRDYLKSNEKLRVQMVKVMQSLKTCRPSDPLGHVASILRGESPAAEARSTARVDLVWGECRSPADISPVPVHSTRNSASSFVCKR